VSVASWCASLCELVEDEAHEGPFGLVGAYEGVDQAAGTDAGQRHQTTSGCRPQV
jgi:hypothetical protein